jgi:uncharacterized protein YyaL (SSP411 family)
MNRLGNEASLYLRQHADNPVPVHWHPWDDAALAEARERGLPILLSIGYSACHWCHVMAHESFEDEQTAALMNRLFVNVKVDREERPDLDRIYQLSHQLLTGRGGGWPLTVFLEPGELVPFFAGTYFPRQRRYGMPAFSEVLQAAHQWFTEKRDDVLEQNRKLQSALRSIQAAEPADCRQEPVDTDSLIASGAQEFLSRHDAVNGGFGGAPKFPQAPILEAVASLGETAAGEGLHEGLRHTLERMAQGGLRDHLDGGFFRYCVDATWTIPHFEKMLYDNAMLLPLYAEGASRWNSDALREAAEGIAAWLVSDMLQPSGGFAASIDADADGVEGGFHVWTPAEVEAVLGADAASLFGRAYGLDRQPNFEGEAWHLQRSIDSNQLAQESGRTAGEIDEALAQSRALLLQHRSQRIHPTRDEKQLTSWNALLAGGWIRAARALNRPEWLDHADGIFRFIEKELWRGDRLLAVYNEGSARFEAYLDDYAWLLDALLESLRARWNDGHLAFAIILADTLLERFEDTDDGAFFFSDSSVDVPITRSLILQDDATPAGNAIAVMSLRRLAHLVGEPRYAEAADRCMRRAGPRLSESPLGHASLLRALAEEAAQIPHLVIAGTDPQEKSALKEWAEGRYRVDCYLPGPNTEGLPGILQAYRSDEPVTAWLCRGTNCLPPVNSKAELKELMD